jgi:hypothetical protein
MAEQAVHARKPATGWSVFWTIVSVIFHASVVFSLVYFTPLREWFFKRPDPKVNLEHMSGARLQEIVSRMLASKTLEIASQIREQQEIAGELDSIRSNSYTHYAAEVRLQEKGQRNARGPEALASLGAPGPDTNWPLAGKNIPELYEIAEQVEITTHGLYRQFRVLELARIQRVSLQEAARATQVAIPEHPAINKTIFSEEVLNTTDGKLDALKAELAKVMEEIGLMISAGSRMLELARLVDERFVTIWGAGGAGLGMGESGRPGRLGDPFNGYSAPDPDAFEHAWGVGVGPVVHMNEVYPKTFGANLGDRKPKHGRKLMAQADEEGEWLFIDTWYIIGPNQNRQGIDKKYPPESSLDEGIDLDAVYIGGDGRPVKWKWMQAIDIPVIPFGPRDYAIWYAFTEIYAEKEQDRWCIFGSDDWGKTWLNGEVVYASGKTPHPWIPDRATKKIHFKKGYNRLLFKLENAWGRTGFSMCIYLGGL